MYSMCINIHWKHREVTMVPPLARGFFWATTSTSTFYYVVKNRLDITPTTPLTLGRSGVDCVEIVWKGKGNFYRLLLNRLIIAPFPLSFWRLTRKRGVNDEKEKGGKRGPAFFPSHHTPYTRLLSFLNLLAKRRYWNARASRDLFRYKYMYESKEFLKKQTNERTKGSLEIVAETEREQQTNQGVAQSMLVCCNVWK